MIAAIARQGRLVWLILAMMLTACAQLGLPRPQTFEEKALATANAVTAVLTTATYLYEVGRIDDNDRTNVLSAADAATQGIAVARSLAAKDPSAAMSQLTAIKEWLSALSAYLVMQERKKEASGIDKAREKGVPA